MATDIRELAENTRGQFNGLFGNMFRFEPEDMDGYGKCYEDVFGKGITISYMSATFYAQFSAELLVGMLSSNPLRKFMTGAIDDEKASIGEPVRYWEQSMNENRFGLPGVDYEQSMKDLYAMMNTSYDKISSLNDWFGTDEGKKEFDMYCLSRKAIRDIKRVVCEYPYLIRKYDHDAKFAQEIMEYAGIISKQIVMIAGGEDAE